MPTYLDSAIESLNNAVSSIGQTVEQWSSSWQSAMDTMRNKAREFVRVFDELEAKRNIAERDEATQKEYDALMEKGRWISDTIRSILDDDTISKNLQGMGVLPLIPIAAVLAAVAAITAWLAPAYVMLEKIELAEKALAQGHDPSAILEAGESSIFTDVSDTTANLVRLSLVGGTLFFLWKFWPVIKKRFA